jgi:hypothetical protein
MRSWTASALGAMTVLLACSRHDDLANFGPESPPEYWVPLRTLPWLADFRLGTAPAQSSRIAHLVDKFDSGEPIYLSMRINDAPHGTVVTIQWYGPGNQALGYQTKAVPSDQERMRFMQSNTLAWPEGTYRAEIWIGDYKLNEQRFHIVSENVGRDR